MQKGTAKELAVLNLDTGGGKKIFEPLAQVGLRSEFSVTQKILVGSANTSTDQSHHKSSAKLGFTVIRCHELHPSFCLLKCGKNCITKLKNIW